MLCPRCKTPCEPDEAFCAACGAPLAPGAEATPTDAGAPTEPLVDYAAIARNLGADSLPELDGAVDTTQNFLPGAGDGWRLSERAKMLAGQDETPFVRGASAPSGGVGDLRVEYCDELFFVAGIQAPFRLRVTPLLEGLRNLWLWCVPKAVAGSRCAPFEVRLEATEFRRGVPLSIDVPFLPTAAEVGQITFFFYFCCQYADHSDFLLLRAEHVVYPSESSVGGAGPNITINTQASGAGENHINLGELLGRNAWRTAGTLLDSLHQVLRRNRLVAKPLEATAWRPENLLLPEGKTYLRDRLTLEFNQRLLQVVTADEVRLGRNPEQNDLVVCELQTARNLKEYPNNTVSRQHAVIRNGRQDVTLQDCSSVGTTVDGAPAEPRESFELPATAELAFGAIRWRMSTQHCPWRPSQQSCHNCLRNKVKCVIFKRADKIPECYVLLWQCCDLGEVDGLLTGYTLLRRNGGILLRTPDGKLQQLLPGRPVAVGTMTLQVREFRQYGL